MSHTQVKHLQKCTLVYVSDTLATQAKVHHCQFYCMPFNSYIQLELVQTVSDWFNTIEEKYSLNYCKYLCSLRVIMLLQPSDSDDSSDDC